MARVVENTGLPHDGTSANSIQAFTYDSEGRVIRCIYGGGLFDTVVYAKTYLERSEDIRKETSEVRVFVAGMKVASYTWAE